MNINEYTFSSVFSKHIDKDGVEYEINNIEIPIIQRDYAQGRIDDKVERIRERFLDTIHDGIKKQKKLTLDFVYGEVNNGKLIPLDGQQRLTTLFLLHWYAAKKEKISEAEYRFLNGFSYYTRPSSRDFCKSLIAYNPDGNKQSMSDEITNQPWFQYQWSSDPTISGMLIMIDAIDKKFSNVECLWDSLVKKQLITFYFLPINEMGMTDDLYIKMNSRGKPLTEFEHFKAEFEVLVAQHDEKISERFNRKFDLDWTDVFFPFRGENKIIDDEFMRYFRFVSDILCYRQNMPLLKDEFKLATNLYGKDYSKAEENLRFLEAAFDCWCGIDIESFFERHFTRTQYECGKTKIFQREVNIFKQCCDNYGEYEGRNRKFPLNMTLLLFAVLVYRQNVDAITEQDFQKRIRIIRNLIWNSPDEIRADGKRNNMPQLLNETEYIMINGGIPATEDTGYNKLQKEEELKKMEWLKSHEEYMESLCHLEDHELLYGCISVIGLDNTHHFDKFRELFNNCDKVLISKALLCIGDYSQTIGYNEKGATWQIGTAIKSTWQDLFHPTNRRDGFDRTKKVLHDLLSSNDKFDDDTLNTLVNDFLNNLNTSKSWRYYFLKYPDMLSDTYGMYFTYGDGDYHTLKMNKLQKNGMTWNVFMLALYYALGEKYELFDYAYQGDKMQISDSLQMDCNNSNYVLYHSDGTPEYFCIEQDENGIDTEDRIEKAFEIVKNATV